MTDLVEPRSPLRWIPWALVLPFNLLIGWPFVLLLGSRYRWRGTGWLTGTWRPRVQRALDWLASKLTKSDPNKRRAFHYSTTLGHGTCFDPHHLEQPDGQPSDVLGHEREHTWQAEELAAMMFVCGAIVAGVTGHWILGLAIWVASYAWLLIAFAVALLRGWRVYRDAWHERAAYALAERLPNEPTRSWRDHFAEEREAAQRRE